MPAGWLWAIFDKDRQTWHDKVMGTIVVRRTNPQVAVAYVAP